MTDGVSPLSGVADAVEKPASPADLDGVDLELLRLLVNDARMSQRSLARELGMSPPAVGERIARLERSGVIRSYTLEIGWAEVGYPVEIYITVTAVQGYPQGILIDALRSIPEVAGINVVTGTIDMLVRVLVRDHNHLRELLLERLWKIPGLQRTETLLTLGEMRPKRFAAELLDSIRGTPNTGRNGGV
jgi:Lrp/AsnC family leucine-responsive transcriptional regulator